MNSSQLLVSPDEEVVELLDALGVLLDLRVKLCNLYLGSCGCSLVEVHLDLQQVLSLFQLLGKRTLFLHEFVNFSSEDVGIVLINWVSLSSSS